MDISFIFTTFEKVKKTCLTIKNIYVMKKESIYVNEYMRLSVDLAYGLFRRCERREFSHMMIFVDKEEYSVGAISVKDAHLLIRAIRELDLCFHYGDMVKVLEEFLKK